MKYHPLTEKLQKSSLWKETKEIHIPLSACDYIIQEYLREKIKEIYKEYQYDKGFSTAHLDRILNLNEPTLEEKLLKVSFEDKDKCINYYMTKELAEKCAKIAEEHFE